jgi:hypothetical protein
LESAIRETLCNRPPLIKLENKIFKFMNHKNLSEFVRRARRKKSQYILPNIRYSPFFYYSPMSLVRIKKSTWPASAFDIWQQCMVLPIFENLFKQHETDIVLFRAFLVFLQIHSSVLILSFKKPLPSERFW